MGTHFPILFDLPNPPLPSQGDCLGRRSFHRYGLNQFEDLVYLQQQARALDDQFKVAARMAHNDLLESARLAVVSDDPEAYKVYRRERHPNESGIVRLANAEHLEKLPRTCRVEFLHHHCSGELIRDVSIKAVHQHRETFSVLWQYSGSP